MTISKDDEREALEYIRCVAGADPNTALWTERGIRYARTILALLDRPVMPKPDDLTDVLLLKMLSAHYKRQSEPGRHFESMRAAYRALYDHYHQPPAPKKVAAWAVVDHTGTRYVCMNKRDAEIAAETYAGRIVHLREVEGEQ